MNRRIHQSVRSGITLVYNGNKGVERFIVEQVDASKDVPPSLYKENIKVVVAQLFT